MKFSVSIDFNDDMWLAETDWSPEKLRESITLLHSRGISEIRWVDHGDFTSEDGVYDEGSGFDKKGCATRIRDIMPDPRQVVIDCCHELGMTVTQVLKPWDLAFGSPSILFPHGKGPQPPVGLPEIGGYGGVAHRWLRDNPDSIIPIHPSLLEAGPRKPVRTIRLWHEQGVLPEAPAIRIYTSEDNFTYVPYEGPVKVTQSVKRRRPPMYAPAPQEKFGPEGEFACVEFTGLNIEAPYFAIEPTEALPVENQLASLVEIEDESGDAVHFTYGLTALQPNGKQVDWKQGGVAFDCARQSQILRILLHRTAALRMPVNLAQQPFLAFARGRNEYRGGHVEFADPKVRAWLNGLVSDALDAGVDAVDIRFGSHTECLDYENYGFHPAIVEAFRERHGVDITQAEFDREAWRDLRGEYVDLWLEEVSQLVRSRGKKMLVHLTDFMESEASERCAYEIAWHWEQWLRSGILDEVTFKSFPMDGDFYHRALALCRENNLPMLWERKPGGSDKQDGWLEAIMKAGPEGFAQFDLYELAVFQTLRADGRLDLRIPYVWQFIAAEVS